MQWYAIYGARDRVDTQDVERGGKVLKEKRQAAGLTVKALSELSGVPTRTIQNWESDGVGHATVGNLLKVAHALGVTLDELAGPR